MDKNLNWKFDISTFRLLGRELITDRITALVELVKNSYDANAKNVYIEFTNCSDKKNGMIIIRDDGFGMSSKDIETKWMTIGTDSKRKNKYTKKPFNRRVVGEKGVGRFAIDKLGSDCKIYTKKKRKAKLNLLIIDWSKYEENEETDNFNLVNNKLKSKKFNSECSGVKIKIKTLRDFWTESDIQRVYKEMAKIVSPFNSLYPPFNIHIKSNESKKFSSYKLVTNNVIKYATETIDLTYDLQKNIQEVIGIEDGNLITIKEKIKSFGPLRIRLYYFNQGAKGNFTKNYKGSELQIDGMRIYRDGILTTPFAEDESHADHQRDILGLDKRRWSGFFDKISSRDLIGIIEITKEHSPKIVDSTNRQDFLDNEEYQGLKSFLFDQVTTLEKYLKNKKKQQYEEYDENLEEAKENLGEFSERLKKLKNDVSKDSDMDFQLEFKNLEKSARDTRIALKQGLKQQQEERQEAKRKESMYMSLMSLQAYALEITHIIKTSLASIKRMAEFNNKHFFNKDVEDYVRKYNPLIVHEIDKLSTAIEFMSTYTRSEKNWEDFDVKTTINSVFTSFEPIFERNEIRVILEIESNVILHYNSILFEDIFKNLISNSIKFLDDIDDKTIKISAFIEEQDLIVIFSDNGKGIEEKNRKKLYEIYYTTTSEDGGNGMGLYMVKTNLDAVKGSIEIIGSELNKGASFKLKFPFNVEMDES